MEGPHKHKNGKAKGKVLYESVRIFGHHGKTVQKTEYYSDEECYEVRYCLLLSIAVSAVPSDRQKPLAVI